MTRDEAEAVWLESSLRKGSEDFTDRMKPEYVDDVLRKMAMHDIEGFVALGILKLDEPKSVKDKLYDAYTGYASLTPSGLLEQLDRVGLKLTDK